MIARTQNYAKLYGYYLEWGGLLTLFTPSFEGRFAKGRRFHSRDLGETCVLAQTSEPKGLSSV
jgi:hypothetical protein